MNDNKIYKWEYFWENLYFDISAIDSPYNIDYLNCAKFWLKNLINWTEKNNKQNNLSEIRLYKLYQFIEINYLEYKLYFDWCIIKDEIKYNLKNKPTSFNSMVSKIYQLFDFLLSYNSLIDCPINNNFELYYVQCKGEIFYECKVIPVIYDLNLNIVNNITVDYCTTQLLRTKKILREYNTKELKYSFEYFCSPIWIKENSTSIFENIPIEHLPVEEDLKKDIADLNIIYQSTYNKDYPPEPIKLNLDKELFFLNNVLNSSLRLKDTLPSNYEFLFDGAFWEERIREIKSKINVFNNNLESDTLKLKNPIHIENITYSIISRGEMIISYNNKTIKISGELIFNPPTFYADLVALEKTNEFTNDEKKEIINFIENDSEKTIGTKIIFD